MSKSLIQVANQSAQVVGDNSIISLGSVQRRFGCNLRLSGNAIEVDGQGYYTVDAAVSLTPTATGDVVVALYNNGVQISGAIAYASVTADDTITLPLIATLRQGCCCDSADNLTVVLVVGAGVVQNISLRVEKV